MKLLIYTASLTVAGLLFGAVVFQDDTPPDPPAVVERIDAGRIVSVVPHQQIAYYTPIFTVTHFVTVQEAVVIPFDAKLTIIRYDNNKSFATWEGTTREYPIFDACNQPD